MTWPRILPHHVPEACRIAVAALERRDVAIADVLARAVVATDPEQAVMWNLIGRLHLEAGQPVRAAAHFRRALESNPSFKIARTNLGKAEARPGRTSPQHRGERFLMSKAWGCGFWSDVDHVVGCLLLAEATGRTFVPHWGANSRFRPSRGAEDVFRVLFDWSGRAGMEDLRREGNTYFPPKWTASTLPQEQLNVFAGPGSQTGAASFIARTEGVAVADFHIALADVLPWLPEGNRYEGVSIADVYRSLMAEHLRPVPEIAAQVDRQAAILLKDRPVIAAHIRGSDKFQENPEIGLEHAEIRGHVERFLAAAPGGGVLLITDSQPALREFRTRFGDRLKCAPCIRTDGPVGVHTVGSFNGHTVGSEVLVDACLAARCDAFVGSGSSNVACAVMHMRAWEPGACVLIGEPYQHRSGIYAYSGLWHLWMS
jgi:protein O-GlcNAc transferase